MTRLKVRTGNIVLAAVAAGLSIGLIAWQSKKPTPSAPAAPAFFDNDTVPVKEREKKIRDLDDALDELNSVDIAKELAKAKEEIAAAMSSIDMEKISNEVKKAMKEVDMEKIKADVEEAVAKIDWDKIKAEIDDAQKVQIPKLEEELAKLKKEMEKIGPQIEKELAKAKVEIENAKAEIKEYKTFVDGLESDGLINKKEGYTLKHKDGELIINGKKASGETYNKYRSFLEKHKKFTIRKDDDDFDIDMD